MRSRSHRLLTLLILFGWIVPQSTALSWSLHFALEHDGDNHSLGSSHDHPEDSDHHHDSDHHGSDHHRDDRQACDHLAHRVGLSALTEALAHGHSHEDSEAAPDHEHEAPAHGSTSMASGKILPIAVQLVPTPPAPPSASDLGYESAPRRAPPPPLFTTHCSLLL